MSRFPIALGLLPVLALAACGGAAHPPVVTEAASPPVAADSASAAEIAALPIPPSGPVDEPGRLKGLSGRQVIQVLGTPGFRRRDNPAEIWQYRTHACTLDLFLYDAEGGQTVTHFAVRSPSAISDRDCFDAVVGQDKAKPTS
jgi:hypothetical protein